MVSHHAFSSVLVGEPHEADRGVIDDDNPASNVCFVFEYMPQLLDVPMPTAFVKWRAELLKKSKNGSSTSAETSDAIW